MRPINELILGDTLEVLKNIDSEYFDLGITSPPYNKKNVQGKIIKKVEYDLYDDNLPEELYQQNQIDVLINLKNDKRLNEFEKVIKRIFYII